MSNIHTFQDLYNYLFSLENQEFNNLLNQKWQGKDIQESIFRLFCYLELFDDFKEYNLCNGNFNKKTIKEILNLKIELQKIMKSSLKDKGDKSDLTFKNNNNLIITTSKNLKDYNIGDLDLRDLLAISLDKYKDYKIRYCLVVKSKKELKKITKNAEKCNQDLKDIILNKTTIIIDWEDLEEAFFKFKNLPELKVLLTFQKESLQLKFHQQLSINKTIELSKIYSQILWGHIPRSGKSYIMSGLIDKFSQNNKKNFLIITTSPNETINQYLDIFRKYQQFNNFNLISMNDNFNKKNTPQIKEFNIVICSKQFLQSKGTKYIEKTNIIDWLGEMKFDIRFIDESHNGGTTELAQKTLDLYGNDKQTLSIYITATYLKPTNDYQIQKEAWVLWDLEDVNLCKNILLKESQNKLIEKYGKETKTLLKHYNLNKLQEEYLKYPKLEILTWKFKDDVINDIKENLNTENGFSIESLLLLKNEVNNKQMTVLPQFQNPDLVKKLSWNLFGKKTIKKSIITEDKEYKNNFLKIINSFVNSPTYNSRWFNQEKPLSILCFLPIGLENLPIDLLSQAYQDLLEKENILPNFNIVSINSKINNGKNPKDIVDDAYQKTINDNKEGLLILSGKQLSLGVSLYHCDIVILMNNLSSMDMIYQMMFRCMTEDDNKKCGFVVDLDLDRSINIMADYSTKIYQDSTSIKDNIKNILSQNLIGFNSHEWNKDIFGIEFSNLDLFTEKVYQTYVSHPSKTIDKIIKFLDFKQDLFTKEDGIIMNKLFDVSGNDTKVMKDIINQIKNGKINNGIDKKATLDSEISTDTKNKKKEEKHINIMKDIMKHLIPLLCLLTIHDNSSSFEDLVLTIQSNKILKDILINQIHTWWGNKFNDDILQVFLILYQKRLKDNKEFNLICSRIKELFSLNLHNQRELSKLIDKYLIPQEIEKKSNAEVSTPFQLRQEMLSKIPIEFWQEKHKVFEPCSGKGGFLIDIIDLFMKHLDIKDKKLRYKTIVEECLYFSDINDTNIYLNKLLLDPYNQYQLNYNIGDTLELDIKSKWKLNGFDAVIGNPPYNKSNSIGTGTPIWHLFVINSLNIWLNKKGLLVLIHPSGWRKDTDTGYFKNLYKLMTTENNLKYLEIHNSQDGMKYFNCGTRYDWYLIEKNNTPINTIIKNEKNIIEEINLKNTLFCPNYLINYILTQLISTKNIQFQRNCNYHSSTMIKKGILSNSQSNKYCYKVIHSITKDGIIYKYSCDNSKESFGIPKLIMADNTSMNDVIIDDKGIYGTTEHIIYIEINDLETSLKIKKALLTDKFKDIINAINLSNYQLDYKILSLLKKDFWNEFI